MKLPPPLMPSSAWPSRTRTAISAAPRIDALGQMENRTERDAVAMDLMSESAQELNPLIDAGSNALKQYADEAHDMGYVLDNDALTSLKAVDTGFQTLQKTQEAVKNQMAAEFAPYLTKALEDIRELIQKVGKTLVESGAVDAFGSILWNRSVR